MASTKILLYKSKTLKSGSHPIVLRVIHNRLPKYYTLGSCKTDYWDYERNRPNSKHPHKKKLNHFLNKREIRADEILLDFEFEDKPFSFEDFERKFNGTIKKITIPQYFDQWIKDLEQLGKVGTARTYKDSKSALLRFCRNNNVEFGDVDYSFLKNWEKHHFKNGSSGNSLSVYLRTLRSLFNKAIVEGYCKEGVYPFRKYKIRKVEKPTMKRALSKEELHKIIDAKIEKGTELWHARNYFLFSFYNMGMNFIDVANLKWTDINSERLAYNRSKTGRNYNVKLLLPARNILDQYKSTLNSSQFIFPILNPSYANPESIHNRVKKVRRKVNQKLRELGESLEITNDLTTYVARHSWATILKQNGVSESIISEGLGHSTERTTKIYLKSFENSVLDTANEKLIQ